MSEQFFELGDDAQHHLNGAFSLFDNPNHKWSPVLTDLRGAAFWIYLRESIPICFLYEQGRRFDIGLIGEEVFGFGLDEAWANRMTYLLARVCILCWGDAPIDKAEDMGSLHALI